MRPIDDPVDDRRSRKLAVRTAVEGDLPRLGEMEARCFHRPWTMEMLRDEHRRPQTRMWVAHPATDEADILSYAIVLLVDREAELLRIATQPSRRRRGVAKELLYRILTGLDADRCLLEVGEDNLGAQRLYHSLGARLLSRRRGYYGSGADALVLAIDLPVDRRFPPLCD